MGCDEDSAKKYGVVVLHLLPWGPCQEHCTAVNFLTGKQHLEGHPLWVRKTLARDKVRVIAEYGEHQPKFTVMATGDDASPALELPPSVGAA
jgi:hypothetical protein